MIGISSTLCYPQIGAPNLFCLRALDQICPLTKHIRPPTKYAGTIVVGLAAFSGSSLQRINNGNHQNGVLAGATA